MKNIILLIVFLLGFSMLVKSQTFEHFEIDSLYRGSCILRSNFDLRGDTAIHSSCYVIRDREVLRNFVRNTLEQSMPLETKNKMDKQDRLTLQIYFDKTGKMFYGQFRISKELLSLFSDDELFKIYKAFQKQPLDMNNIDLRQPDEGKTFTFGILNIFISPKIFQ